MFKKKAFLLIFSFMLFSSIILANSSRIFAADFYGGYSVATQSSSNFGIIVRFKSTDFTLSEADSLYSGVVNMAISQLSGSGVSVTSTIPSQALANGYSGEVLWNLFTQNGVNMFNPAVSQILFLSLYGCDYQGASHMCIRTYVHTGSANLSSFGIPYNTVAGLGAFVVVTPVWNSLKALLLSGSLLPK